jgi:membrane associated rhomboid family serine protease
LLFPLRDYRRSQSFPWVTVVIIAINILVFLYQALVVGQNPSKVRVQIGGEVGVISHYDYFIYKYGLTPCEILLNCPVFSVTDFPVWMKLFTSMFLHGDILHIASNMWFLWIFGDNVEDAMGKVRFALFYFMAGLVAALAQILANTHSISPMVGASGAIAGVLGAYLLLYPFARVLTVLFLFIIVQLIEMPAIVVLGFWFLLQLISSLLGGGAIQGGGIAYMAHIGGFMSGLIFVRFFAKKSSPPDPI